MKKIDEMNDPGSCFNKAADDEPIFVLLGRDHIAPATIRYWAIERVRRGINLATDDKIKTALAFADEMELHGLQFGQSLRTIDGEKSIPPMTTWHDAIIADPDIDRVKVEVTWKKGVAPKPDSVAFLRAVQKFSMSYLVWVHYCIHGEIETYPLEYVRGMDQGDTNPRAEAQAERDDSLINEALHDIGAEPGQEHTGQEEYGPDKRSSVQSSSTGNSDDGLSAAQAAAAISGDDRGGD